MPRLQQSGLPLVEWQPDPGPGAFANVAFEIDPAVVIANDPLHDHQAQTGTLLLGGVERLEDAVDLFLWNATAGVAHAYHHAIHAGIGLHVEHAAPGHGLDGVFDQV